MENELMDYIKREVQQVLGVIDSKAYRCFENAQLLSGKLLRESWLYTMLQNDDTFNDAIFEAIKKNHPYLWNRMIFMLAFGYETGKVFHQLIDDNEDRSRYSCYMASLFNFIVSLYDYLADELHHHQILKNTISVELLSQLLLNNSSSAFLAIQKINTKTTDPCLQLLIAGIYSWIIYTQKIYSTEKCRDMGLHKLIVDLFIAENIVIEKYNQIHCNKELRSNVLLKKSAGPFIAIGKFILEITPQVTLKRIAIFEQIVKDIGEVFFIVDDLSDIEKDFSTQSGNNIILTSGIRNSSEMQLSNILFINTIDSAIKRLLQLIENIKINEGLLSTGTDGGSLDNYLSMNIASWLNLFWASK